MEQITFQELKIEFEKLEYLYQKEYEILTKAKNEGNNILLKNEDIIKEIKDMINIYKQMSSL